MSTFKGRIKELENVLIDDFSNYKFSTCFFLSHCHTDHMRGLDELFSNISNDSNYHVYISPISRLILLNKFNLSSENIIKVITSTEVITVPENDSAPSYQMTVTPIPAGHCPGSVMFLFETVKKNILYTGDFRISKNDITKFKPFHSNNEVKIFDKIYFDSTFLNEMYWDFPLRSEVVSELLSIIKNWINKSPTHNVLLNTSAMYGYEFVFAELARKLKCKIHVACSLYDLFWNVPDVGIFLTNDCSSTRLHAVLGNFPCITENLLRIRLSARWYKSYKGAPKQPICKEISSSKISICFATHCSCSELVDFLNYFRPKSLVPCAVAVGSTKEETESYVEKLVYSWDIQKRKESLEAINDVNQLERNCDFKLKIPIKNADFECNDSFWFPDLGIEGQPSTNSPDTS